MPNLTEEEVKLVLEGAVLNKLRDPNTLSWTKKLAQNVLPDSMFNFFSKKLHGGKYHMAMKMYAELMRTNRLAPARFSDSPTDRKPMTHKQRVYTAARIAGTDPKGFARLFDELIDDYQEEFQSDAEIDRVKDLANSTK